MIEKQKQVDISNSVILKGRDVCLLPSVLLESYCEKISTKLKGPNTIPESPEELYQAMMEGRTVVAMDIFTQEIYGFAQIKPAAETQKKWIFNSWTSWAAVGKPILWNAAALVHNLDPEAQVIAKVREGNIKAQKAIIETGGKLIGYEASEHHFNPASVQPISKEIYDISLETLILKKPLIESSLDIVRKYLAEIPIEPSKQKHPLVNQLKWLISTAIGLKNKLIHG